MSSGFATDCVYRPRHVLTNSTARHLYTYQQLCKADLYLPPASIALFCFVLMSTEVVYLRR